MLLSLVKRWNGMSKGGRSGNIIGIIVLSLLGWAALLGSSYFMLSNIFPVALALGTSVIILFFAAFLRKRTPQCREWMSELLGLRQFIEVAEKERLEALVNENPSYFYDVLPFAYVMGVSDTWSKKFESIAVPPPTFYTCLLYTSRCV